MEWTVVGYVIYLFLSVNLTVWVAWTLSRNGFHFLKDVYAGNEALARAVNHLLVVGFYLLNLGWVLLVLQSRSVQTAQDMIESVAYKLGVVLLVLGLIHMFNLYVLSRARRSTVEARLREARMADRNVSAGLPPMPPPPSPQGAR